MHKKFEITLTRIKGWYKLGRKVVTHNSKSDLPLARGNGQFWAPFFPYWAPQPTTTYDDAEKMT